MRRAMPIVWIFLALVGGVEVGTLMERHAHSTVESTGTYAGPKRAFQPKPEGPVQRASGFLQQA